MNKSELVDEVANKTGLEKRQAESAVSVFLDAVMAETKAGNRWTAWLPNSRS